MTDIPMVDVIEVRALEAHKLRLVFSDGCEGVADLASFVTQGGPMVQALKDPSFFARVFVSSGVPTWPNGFDLDAINLYMTLRDQGLLAKADAA